jgi:hypothetical protein
MLLSLLVNFRISHQLRQSLLKIWSMDMQSVCQILRTLLSQQRRTCQVGVFAIALASTLYAQPKLQDPFQTAMDKAQGRQLESLPLVAVDPNASTVRVVTWLPEQQTVAQADGKTGLLRTSRDIWVALEWEILSRCRSFSNEERENLPLRIRQLLGLPANFGAGRAGGFTVLEVPVDSRGNLFRPCMQPDPTATSCATPVPVPRRDSGVPHEQWMARVEHDSYVANRFPWTQLGYTYDWGTSGSHYGVSEYIVREGANVNVRGWYPLIQFCAPWS